MRSNLMTRFLAATRCNLSSPRVMDFEHILGHEDSELLWADHFSISIHMLSSASLLLAWFHAEDNRIFQALKPDIDASVMGEVWLPNEFLGLHGSSFCMEGFLHLRLRGSFKRQSISCWSASSQGGISEWDTAWDTREFKNPKVSLRRSAPSWKLTPRPFSQHFLKTGDRLEGSLGETLFFTEATEAKASCLWVAPFTPLPLCPNALQVYIEMFEVYADQHRDLLVLLSVVFFYRFLSLRAEWRSRPWTHIQEGGQWTRADQRTKKKRGHW